MDPNVERQIQEYVTVEIYDQTYKLDSFMAEYVQYDRAIFDTSYPRRQLDNLQIKFHSNPTLFYQWVYFTLHPSILFGKVPLNSYRMTATSEVAKHLIEKNSTILNVFGRQMNYSSVVKAIQTLGTDDRIKNEIDVVLNCKVLKITSANITHFRVIQLLYNISKSLQDFIGACTLCKFDVVVHPTSSFSMLRNEVQAFYSSENNDCTTCLAFFDRLFLFFCLTDEDTNLPYVRLLSKIQKLKKVFAVAVLPISYTYYGPELWEFFHSKRWLDTSTNSEEGLQRYYKNNDTVYSILTQYEAYDEELIIKSLTPIVRFFHFVQKYTRCTNLIELVADITNDTDRPDMKLATTNNTFYKDVHDANSRIEAIKDLFLATCGRSG